jgi:serine/threonine protein kinase
VYRGREFDFEVKREKGQLWGSPVYFSPSMVSNSTFSLSDDVWALGIITYELFCKTQPFRLTDL